MEVSLWYNSPYYSLHASYQVGQSESAVAESLKGCVQVAVSLVPN